MSSLEHQDTAQKSRCHGSLGVSNVPKMASIPERLSNRETTVSEALRKILRDHGQPVPK